MFSYYGSKSKIVNYYPPPKYDKIIEPFAGSARYSLKYWQNDITLIDKYDIIIDIWMYLKNASKNDILKLPILEIGEDIRNIKLSKEEIPFMRYFIGQGLSAPQWKVSSYCTKSTQASNIKRIADNLFKIKHWKIKQGDYIDLENTEATWFIDPPYQNGGHKYIESNKNIDYTKLAEWCKNRNGQIIVCENTKATWLPFKQIIDMQGAMFKTTEAIWSNHKTNYDNTQLQINYKP